MTDAVRSEETRATLEFELFQSQKLETVGRLAGGIAHDFNNLLTVILGYTEVLMNSGANSDKTLEFLGLVHHAGLEARDLTRNLMAFSRRQLLNVSPIDVNAVVMDFSGLLERIVGDGVEFTLVESPVPLVVLGDRSQLDQILMNLVVNARDSMPAGGVITVETARSDREGSTGANGDYAMIKVSDTGCGMDEETVEHIFEPFFTTKGKEKGTGLGLATTYGIVKQHQGSISVRTKPGSGTSMIICLPLTDQQPTETQPEASAVEPVSGSATVLVLEDDPVIRSLSAKVLRDSGYNVIEASDSREAVEMCGGYAGPIHLVLSDMVMPGMSGIEACEEIRKLRPETRVLLMSGFNDGKHTPGEGHACDGFIQKPFTLNNLLDKCRQILGHT
jgi:CheY-like chemotaxis protein